MHPKKINHTRTDGFQIKLQDLMGLGFLNCTVYILKLSCLSRWEWAASGPGTDEDQKKAN